MSNKTTENTLPNVRHHVDRIISTCESLEITLPDSVEDLKDWLIDSENQIARAMAKQGLGFIALKQQVEEGQWLNWLEENSFDRRRVGEQMRVAQMLLNAPETARPKLYGITSKAKLITLASLPAETIEDIAETGEIGELDALSVRDMKQRIRELQAEKADTSKKLETAEMALQAEKQKRKADFGGEFPEFYTDMRHEAAALAEQVLLGIDALNNLVREADEQLDNCAKLADDNASHFALMAASSLSHHLRAVAASSQRTLSLAQQWHFVGDLSADLFMSEAEIAEFLKARELLVQQHKHDAISREQARQMTKKRGRGRPAKLVQE